MPEILGIVREDLPDVARIHILAFPGSALTALGDEAVRRYYLWQIDGPHDCTALKATVDGRLSGFCFGGVFRGALGGFLQAHRNYLALRVLTHPWLIANPLFRDRLLSGLRVLRRRSTAPPAEKGPRQPDSYAILSIAVDPAVRGAGIGRALMLAAESDAISRGFKRMHLTVDPSNTVAIRFYEGLGWRRLPAGEGWNGTMTREIGG